MTTEFLGKSDSYFACSDCEPGLKIELLKILEKLKKNLQESLLDVLVHFYLTPISEFELEYVVSCV